MKIGCFIPIRLDSERLPGKCLKEAAGQILLYHLLDRVADCKLIKNKKDIVVCTTTHAVDDRLVGYVESWGASCFRGNKDDLIQRFKDAEDFFGFDYVLQVDGDDPCVDPEYMDLTLQALIDDPTLDACTSRGLPFGINVKSYTGASIYKVHKHYSSMRNDNGYALYFIASDLCKCRYIDPISPDHVLDEARLTLDYEQDVTVFRKILEALYVPGKPPARLAEIVKFLKANPEVMKINNVLQEQYMERAKKVTHLEYVDANGVTQRVI